jgi:AmmeMemoRadiSam system protein A
MLTDHQKQALIELARTCVVAEVLGIAPSFAEPPELPLAAGAFVTIRTRGQLRGCLGTLGADLALVEQIARCAADAASEDPRFPPVSAHELAELSIEVSVLSPLEPVDPRDETAIVVGRHGLVIERGRHRGLLLPQVAVEWGWTREQFLWHTCVKAGLPGDAWQRGSILYRFEAEVFGD